jgi:hypothetical protein
MTCVVPERGTPHHTRGEADAVTTAAPNAQSDACAARQRQLWISSSRWPPARPRAGADSNADGSPNSCERALSYAHLSMGLVRRSPACRSGFGGRSDLALQHLRRSTCTGGQCDD